MSTDLGSPAPAQPDFASLGLPPADQVGFVVRDLQAAMARYGALFGPWSTMDGSVEGCTFRGRIADAKLALAFGRSGPLEIELIEWQGGESPHGEFIQQGREGMHHLRFRVDDADAWIEKVAQVGYQPIWYKKYCADTTFAYLERPGDPLVIELLEMPPGGPGTGGQ
jgi:methylmalonyl-CoA/ethylmalonyl-CoA epimerase